MFFSGREVFNTSQTFKNPAISEIVDFGNNVLKAIEEILSDREREAFYKLGGVQVISEFIDDILSRAPETIGVLERELVAYIFKVRRKISIDILDVAFTHKEQILGRTSLMYENTNIIDNSLTPIAREIFHFLLRNKGKMSSVQEVLDYVYQKDEEEFNEREPHPHHLNKYFQNIDTELRKYGYSLLRVRRKGIILLKDGEHGEGISIGNNVFFYPEGNFIAIGGNNKRHILSPRGGEVLSQLLRPRGRVIDSGEVDISVIKRLRKTLKMISPESKGEIKNIYSVGYYFSDGETIPAKSGNLRTSSTVVGKKRRIMGNQRGEKQEGSYTRKSSLITKVNISPGDKKRGKKERITRETRREDTKKIPKKTGQVSEIPSKEDQFFREIYPGISLCEKKNQVKILLNGENTIINVSKAQRKILMKITSDLGIIISSQEYLPNVIQSFFKRFGDILTSIGWSKIYIPGLGYKVIPKNYLQTESGNREFIGVFGDTLFFSESSRLLYNLETNRYCTLGEKEAEIIVKMKDRKKGVIDKSELSSKTIAHVLYNKLIDFSPKLLGFLKIIPRVGLMFSLEGIQESDTETSDMRDMGNGLYFDRAQRRIIAGQTKIELTPLESRTLEQILLSEENKGYVRVQDKIVSYIRAKLRETFGIEIDGIYTMKGEGYYFEKSGKNHGGVEVQPGLYYIKQRRALVSSRYPDRVHLTVKESEIFEDTFLRIRENNTKTFCNSSRKRLREKISKMGYKESL